MSNIKIPHEVLMIWIILINFWNFSVKYGINDQESSRDNMEQKYITTNQHEINQAKQNDILGYRQVIFFIMDGNLWKKDRRILNLGFLRSLWIWILKVADSGLFADSLRCGNGLIFSSHHKYFIEQKIC